MWLLKSKHKHEWSYILEDDWKTSKESKFDCNGCDKIMNVVWDNNIWKSVRKLRIKC